MSRLYISIFALSIIALPARADDWPQWLGPQRDGVWRETGIVKTLPKDGLPVLWRKPVAQGYAGPAVANGKVFVTDWVRDKDAKPPASAFARSRMAGVEQVHCFDEATGGILWTHKYDCPYAVSYPGGPRCTPLVSGNRVYTLGTMGDLFCLDVEKGSVIWSKSFVKDYKSKVPVWGFSGHPLLDGDRLICLVGGEDDSMVVAFHKDTGKEIWHALPTIGEGHGPGYAPPTMITAGKTKQLIVWHPEAVTSLNPDDGKMNWQQEFKLNAGMAIATPRQLGDRLFVTAFYNGPIMFQLSQEKPAARILWRGQSNSERKTDGLHAVMSTPYLKDDYIYGVCSYGQLRCLRISSGERVWESLKPIGGKEQRWGHAFIIPHGDHCFLFNEMGELILANLTPDGYEELGRTKVIEPTNTMPGRPVVWMHPAFANKHMYARNDKEIVCVSLEEKK